MKERAIVCNIGHFDNEIQIAGLKNLKWHNIKPQVDEIEFPRRHRIILLSEGRLVNLGNAMGHPCFVMSASFTDQTLAQIELLPTTRASTRKRFTCFRNLDEKVALLHLAKIGVKLTQLAGSGRIHRRAGPARSSLTIIATEVRALPWQSAKLSSPTNRNEVGSFLSDWSLGSFLWKVLQSTSPWQAQRRARKYMLDVNTWSRHAQRCRRLCPTQKG